jgi:hypothetical protein
MRAPVRPPTRRPPTWSLAHGSVQRFLHHRMETGLASARSCAMQARIRTIPFGSSGALSQRCYASTRLARAEGDGGDNPLYLPSTPFRLAGSLVTLRPDRTPLLGKVSAALREG